MTATAAAPTPTVLARRWIEDMWNHRDRALLVQIMAPHCNGVAESGAIQGRDAWISGAFEVLLATFPDFHLTVEGTVAEANEVVVRWRATGTHQGDVPGLAATGRKVKFRGMTWLRFHNGQIVEGADSWNQAALMQSLATGKAVDSVQLL